MKRKSIPMFVVVATTALLAGGNVQADVVSLNFSTANANTQVAGSYGVVPADNWTNSSLAQNFTDLVDDTGTPTTMDATLTAPGGFGFYGATYIGTPLNYGPQTFTTAVTFPTLILTEIPYANYYAIAYLSGFLANTGSSVTDGTTTYYWMPANPADATLTETADTNSGDGFDVGNYALFGSMSSPLTSSTLSLSIAALSGGGAGFGGVQIVEVSSSTADADFDNDGDVDGRDFLVWQRDGAPGGITAENLQLWQSQYGTNPPLLAIASVPEPGMCSLIFAVVTWLLCPRRKGFKTAQ